LHDQVTGCDCNAPGGRVVDVVDVVDVVVVDVLDVVEGGSVVVEVVVVDDVVGGVLVVAGTVDVGAGDPTSNV
jgi:hypothetical protein